MSRRKQPRPSAEAREAIADSAWWREIEKHLPWRLHGFDWRSGATFHTGGARFAGNPLYDALCPPRSTPNAFIEITGEQRNQLVAAFERKEAK